MLPDIAASRLSKKRPCFLEVILQYLFKPRQACQDGRLEARWINGFKWYSFDVIRPGGSKGRNKEWITIERMALTSKVGECCVMPPAISPKCEFSTLKKIGHCAVLAFTEFRLLPSLSTLPCRSTSYRFIKTRLVSLRLLN